MRVYLDACALLLKPPLCAALLIQEATRSEKADGDGVLGLARQRRQVAATPAFMGMEARS